MLDAPIIEQLNQMQTIDLTEMKSIKLMNRVDTKFIASKDELLHLLELSKNDYRVQIVNNYPIGDYDTIYYDTANLDMYLLHHNRHLQRQKIRTRAYVESQLAFLEIKNKTNKGRTDKTRIKIPLENLQDFSNNPVAQQFIQKEADYKLSTLMPQLRTAFTRITLVNNSKTERLTIDTDLHLENLQTGKTINLPNVLIIELKQDGLCHSEMKAILQDLRIKKTNISKYCIGMVLTNSVIKNNRFKRKAVLVQQVNNNTK